MVETRVEKKSDEIRIPIGRLRQNPWIICTILLAILLVIMLFVKSGGSTSASISSDQASKGVIGFVNSQVQGGNATVVSSVRQDSFYLVTVAYNGQNIPVYVTLDGKYLVTQPIPLTSGGSTSASANPSNTGN